MRIYKFTCELIGETENKLEMEALDKEQNARKAHKRKAAPEGSANEQASQGRRSARSRH